MLLKLPDAVCDAHSTDAGRWALQPLHLIIAGAPASGKGTQCELIVKQYGVVHISTGDLLRAEVDAETPHGVAAKDFIEKGELVPDDVVIDMVIRRLAEEDCVAQGWLLARGRSRECIAAPRTCTCSLATRRATGRLPAHGAAGRGTSCCGLLARTVPSVGRARGSPD